MTFEDFESTPNIARLSLTVSLFTYTCVVVVVAPPRTARRHRHDANGRRMSCYSGSDLTPCHQNTVPDILPGSSTICRDSQTSRGKGDTINSDHLLPFLCLFNRPSYSHEAQNISDLWPFTTKHVNHSFSQGPTWTLGRERALAPFNGPRSTLHNYLSLLQLPTLLHIACILTYQTDMTHQNIVLTTGLLIEML